MSPHVNEHAQAVGPEVPGWSPRTPPVPVVLEGRYVRLEPVAAAHAEPLFEALGAAEDAPLWTYRPAAQPADAAAMARDVVAPLAAHTGALTFAIVPTDGAGPARAAGLATYWRVEPTHGVVEISGVLFARRLQRTRAATEAMHLMIGHAIEEWGYRRVEWKCDALNEPSRRAAARLGFTYEGRFRQHMVTKGRSRDTDWFSLLDGEWPTVRAAHERWLDPANFHADGRQRARLEVPPPSQG
ncbi:GNAT family N-acetyltransferase [Nocardioides sp. zg-579]|uniref:GNAT family N-acetyltransferase n=1 Tax=Nocardioides marmotae TaxID=2663857 RepID=A0A6I3JGI1_9ACTN|nr:GNAT family protein [Nocardioides marmotae]MCR6033487.1 GNAT family N-acetyltransferase [Gordonia jinghuaiqii]MTB97145.1 GNAT family N-acetyltransferase [Nocardioides marmotae]QKE00796.1 GNAT family N-acetyltransferase [Nocardioides marmotae]